MPSDKHNSRTARITDFISSLINVASSRDMPFRQPQQLQCLHNGATFVPLCAPILSLQPCIGDDLQQARNGFSKRRKDFRGTSYTMPCLQCHETSSTLLKFKHYGFHALRYGANASQVIFPYFP